MSGNWSSASQAIALVQHASRVQSVNAKMEEAVRNKKVKPVPGDGGVTVTQMEVRERGVESETKGTTFGPAPGLNGEWVVDEVFEGTDVNGKMLEMAVKMLARDVTATKGLVERMGRDELVEEVTENVKDGFEGTIEVIVTEKVVEEMANKADATYVDGKVNELTAAIGTKTDATYVDGKVNELTAAIGTKANVTYVDGKVDEVNGKLDEKANVTYVDGKVDERMWMGRLMK